MAMTESGRFISRHGLEAQGIGALRCAHWNYVEAALYGESIVRKEGRLAQSGPLVVATGQHTGRSAKDKFIVRDSSSESNVWWGEINKPIAPERVAALRQRLVAHLADREVFVQDCFAGADPAYRLPIRIITEFAWHSLFARNMFIPGAEEELVDHAPEFTVIAVPSFAADAERDGTRSGTFIIVDFTNREVLIGGTSYAGEIKKSVFTILNYLLPERGVLPMHCSVNVGESGDAAVFFGLSGTGKTTLSADPNRTLIGDDEHGWSDRGLFNFEGGCYAKVIRLSADAEPEIYQATHRFGTVMENVVIDEATRRVDLDDASLTENTRASYPLSFIPNASMTGVAGHPRSVIMLTADAFGVLPPIARLSPAQAMYHFLSGYTAKVAGTEKGLGSEPQATFSTCFGAPFMPRHPSVYARMLRDKVAEQGAYCWLVNTGWSGGAYGVGERMKIAYTRALLSSALDGGLNRIEMSHDNIFGLEVPVQCPGIPNEILNPRGTWADKSAYDDTARDLIGRFHDNFAQFESYVTDEVRSAAPKAA